MVDMSRLSMKQAIPDVPEERARMERLFMRERTRRAAGQPLVGHHDEEHRTLGEIFAQAWDTRRVVPIRQFGSENPRIGGYPDCRGLSRTVIRFFGEQGLAESKFEIKGKF